ncbi:MAG TPA: 1,4-dihydroxy-2-naphthoate polyprenyltransferase [Myxococcota bacterium]|nr:1,4-dihydroxy-2-naphthoate polyprenyltransferase [Myxococcota bacterium]
MAAVSKSAAWLAAARPRTLPAALAPIAVGTAVAAAQGAARPGIAALALVTALALQLAANFANDLFDFEKGADTEARKGPPRAVQSGWLTPREMRAGIAAACALALGAGGGLVAAGGWPIALAGALALAAALAYTGGPWPLGYHGLGDALVFLFFGVVGVAGSHYVQARAASALALWASVPVGLLVTAILAVNNLRDLDTDAHAGKRTLAVRIGAPATRAYYAALLALAFAVPPALVAAGALSRAALLPLLASPLAAVLAVRVARARDADTCNAALSGTAQLAALFAGLFALGIAAGSAA